MIDENVQSWRVIIQAATTAGSAVHWKDVGSQLYMAQVRLGEAMVKGLVGSIVSAPLFGRKRGGLYTSYKHLLVYILCIQGETCDYPMAEVELEVQAWRAQLHIKVVKLPWLIILGKDWVGYSALMQQSITTPPRTGKSKG